MFWWVTSVGTVVWRSLIRLPSGIAFGWSRLVIGMFSRVSIDLISPSGYCTPTKYWLPPTGSIQKFFLLNWMLELKRGDDVLHDVFLGQPQVGGLGPVDVDDVFGIVEPLDDPGVDHAVDLGRIARGSARRSRGPCLVLAGDADVDRRRLPFVHRAADQAAGVEAEVEVAEPRVLRDARADQVDVFLRRLVRAR